MNRLLAPDLMSLMVQPYRTSTSSFVNSFNTGIHTSHSDTEYVYHFPLPGVADPSSVEITCDERYVSVYSQSDFTRFEYSTTVPKDGDTSNASAEVKNGMLKIVFPKTNSDIRRIPVSSGVPTMNGYEVTVGDCDA